MSEIPEILLEYNLQRNFHLWNISITREKIFSEMKYVSEGRFTPKVVSNKRVCLSIFAARSCQSTFLKQEVLFDIISGLSRHQVGSCHFNYIHSVFTTAGILLTIFLSFSARTSSFLVPVFSRFTPRARICRSRARYSLVRTDYVL